MSLPAAFAAWLLVSAVVGLAAAGSWAGIDAAVRAADRMRARHAVRRARQHRRAQLDAADAYRRAIQGPADHRQAMDALDRTTRDRRTG